jgi:hypothetical protein
MDEEKRDAMKESVRLFMSRLADWIAPRFPHQTAAIRQELGRPRMTTDRWNCVAVLLASLHAVPGVALGQPEHEVRNVALHAITVAQKMAAAGLGCTRDPDGCIDFAAWLAAEISARMKWSPGDQDD